jgi:hypothetical protein
VLWIVLGVALFAQGLWTLATRSWVVGGTWLLIGFVFAEAGVFWWNEEQD